MNAQIEWKGGVPEALASIYGTMAGDGESLLRAAWLLWGDDLVDRIIADSDKKVQRVEDILDGKDPIEGIENRLEELVKSLNKEKSPYLTTGEAALYLKASVQSVYDWVKRGKLHPVPGRRRVFTKEALDRFYLTRRRRK